VKLAYFYRFESEEIQLTMETFIEILDVLKVSAQEFFCRDLNREEIEIAKSIKTLSRENKETILDLIKKLR